MTVTKRVSLLAFGHMSAGGRGVGDHGHLRVTLSSRVAVLSFWEARPGLVSSQDKPEVWVFYVKSCNMKTPKPSRRKKPSCVDRRGPQNMLVC